MVFSSPYPLETRQAVEALLHESELTMRAIAERTTVSYATVKLWNREARIRPWTRAAKLDADPATWTIGRRRAVNRLFGQAEVDPGDLAEALGSRRRDAPALMLACGLAVATRRPALEPTGEAPDIAALDTALRAHIARQIAAFDETLHDAGGAVDTARVLRDLGGLKRLLDDVAMRAVQSEFQGDADGESPQDLATLRDRLARRIEAFVAGRRGTAAAGGSGADAPPVAGA